MPENESAPSGAVERVGPRGGVRLMLSRLVFMSEVRPGAQG